MSNIILTTGILWAYINSTSDTKTKLCFPYSYFTTSYLFIQTWYICSNLGQDVCPISLYFYHIKIRRHTSKHSSCCLATHHGNQVTIKMTKGTQKVKQQYNVFHRVLENGESKSFFQASLNVFSIDIHLLSCCSKFFQYTEQAVFIKKFLNLNTLS